jgi:hypothetical protein
MVMFIVGIGVGVATSFVASGLFVYFLYLYHKPTVAMSESIAYDGKTYDVKVVNKGRYPLINLRCECYKIKETEIPKGRMKSFFPLPLKLHELLVLEPFADTSSHEDYSWRFEIHDDLYKLFDAGYYLQFKLVCQSALSNVTAVFERTYASKASIRDGTFPYGPYLDVESLPTAPQPSPSPVQAPKEPQL